MAVTDIFGITPRETSESRRPFDQPQEHSELGELGAFREAIKQAQGLTQANSEILTGVKKAQDLNQAYEAKDKFLGLPDLATTPEGIVPVFNPKIHELYAEARKAAILDPDAKEFADVLKKEMDQRTQMSMGLWQQKVAAERERKRLEEAEKKYDRKLQEEEKKQRSKDKAAQIEAIRKMQAKGEIKDSDTAKQLIDEINRRWNEDGTVVDLYTAAGNLDLLDKITAKDTPKLVTVGTGNTQQYMWAYPDGRVEPVSTAEGEAAVTKKRNDPTGRSGGKTLGGGRANQY